VQGGYGGLSGGSHRRRRRGIGKRARHRGRSRGDSIRDRVLREFRGIGEPLDLNKNISKVGDLLTGILQDLKLSEGIEESRLRSAWLEVAGEFVAKQTEPVSLRDGILTLRVLQPSMRFHLEQSRGQLLRRLKQRLGPETIREVRLTIG